MPCLWRDEADHRVPQAADECGVGLSQHLQGLPPPPSERERPPTPRDRRALPTTAEREARALANELYGHRLVAEAPDPGPAKLLRELMAYDRGFGIPFDCAWDENVNFVLARITASRNVQRRERESWRTALDATRDAWEAAWAREGRRLALAVDLLDDHAHGAQDERYEDERYDGLAEVMQAAV